MSFLSRTFFLLLIGCGGQSDSAPAAASNKGPVQTAKNNQPPRPKCQLEINEASEMELLKMDGVGKEKAKDIINYRRARRSEATKKGEEKWNFNSWVDVMKIDGIGEGICEKNKSKICFNGRPSLGCKTGF